MITISRLWWNGIRYKIEISGHLPGPHSKHFSTRHRVKKMLLLWVKMIIISRIEHIRTGVANLYLKRAKIWLKNHWRAIIVTNTPCWAKNNFNEACLSYCYQLIWLSFRLYLSKKTSAGHSKSPGGPKMARGPRVGHPCIRRYVWKN